MAMFSAASAMSASSKTTDRRLAAELQVRPLQVLCRGRGDLVAGPGGAGDRDHRRCLVRDDRPAGVAVAADDVEHAGRQELGGDLGHHAPTMTGVVSLGLSTTQLPAASAGANFQIAIIIG